MAAQHQETSRDKNGTASAAAETKTPTKPPFKAHTSTLWWYPKHWRDSPTDFLLPFLVFLDMFAVAVVVPLMFQYFQRAGVSSAAQREMLSSLFSASQIVGGLLLGVLTDSRIVSPKTVLLISFGGSLLSYALIVVGGFTTLVMSRVLVGLVKQTMTITTSLVTVWTTSETRTAAMGSLTAGSSVAWIAGPTVGAVLFKYVHAVAPAVLACTLFALNMVLAVLFVPDTENHDLGRNNNTSSNGNNKEKTARSSSKTTNLATLWSNVTSCFRSRDLGAIVLAQLIFLWVSRAMNHTSLGSFYEDMYGLEPHHRGYLISYEQMLKFWVQSSWVIFLLKLGGGERRTSQWASLIMTLGLVVMAPTTLPFYLLLAAPLSSVGQAILQVALQSLVTQTAPRDSIFSILAALDVLQSVVLVSVPFYRATLFGLLAPSNQSSAADASDSSSHTMKGDPDPRSWVWTSALHWAVATVLLTFLLGGRGGHGKEKRNGSLSGSDRQGLRLQDSQDELEDDDDDDDDKEDAGADVDREHYDPEKVKNE